MNNYAVTAVSSPSTFHLRAGIAQSIWTLATGWTTEGRSSSSGGVKNCHSSILPRLAQGCTQPLIQRVQGALSLGVKRQGREADHSSPTSADVKKTWISTSTPSYVFMV
jgi:hypothetical protein